MTHPLRFLLPVLLLVQTFATAQRQQVTSPDGKLQAAFALRNGNFYYQLSWQEKPVILESRLELRLAYFGKDVLKPDSLWQGLRWVNTETRAAEIGQSGAWLPAARCPLTPVRLQLPVARKG